MPTLRQSLRELSPVVATATIITTLVVCVVITKARHVYVGGLSWPYFSDMGRDKPAYFVFVIGLSIAAVAIASTWIFNGEFQRGVLTSSSYGKSVSKAVQHSSTAATALAVVSVVALPILAICDTSSFPSVHNAAAYAFFLLQTIAVTINTIVTQRIYAAAQRQVSGSSAALSTDGTGDERRGKFLFTVRRTFLVQGVLYTLFLISFVIYLPVGLAIIKPFKHLTIDECLQRNLGATYCVDDMNYDTTETKLWNYENDFSANQLRAAAQLACIVTLVGYTLTFKTHDYESISETDKAMEAVFLHHGPTAPVAVAWEFPSSGSSQYGTSDLDQESLMSWFQCLCRWRFAPILASVAVVTTLVTCFILTRVNHRYTGGLAWPYFSDMGRDSPNYYVFGVGLSLVAVSIALTWLFNFEYHRKRFASVAPIARPTVWAYCVSYTVLVLGLLSTIGLPVLAWCSTTSCPVIHNAGTFWFFILELVAIIFNTCLSYYIWKVLWVAYTKADRDAHYHAHTDYDDRLERGQPLPPVSPPLLAQMEVAPANVYGIKWAFYWQLVCALLLLASALIYIPIGLAVVGHVPRLLVLQCLDRHLGVEYCTSTMRLDANETKLWNYELKPEANQLRAACQLAAMLSLVGYSLSYLFHDYTVVTTPRHDDPPSSTTPLTSPRSRR